MFVSLTVSTALSEDRLPDSPGGLSAAPNLRTAKSYADLRSYTASPETSTASHPISRLSGPNLHGLSFEGATSINPNGTPTTSSMAARDEGLVERELGRMQIGSNFGQGGEPTCSATDDTLENPGPIGGHRTFAESSIETLNKWQLNNIKDFDAALNAEYGASANVE